MSNISFVNGVYSNHGNSKIDINDRGYHFGDSVYEVIMFNKNSFYDFEGHIQRLFSSLKSIEIYFSFSLASLKIIIEDLIKVNKAN